MIVLFLFLPTTSFQFASEMFPHQTKFAFIFTIFIFWSTSAQNNNNCDRSCGEHSLQYPFGFSAGCEVKLRCNNSKVKIGELQVQNVTSDSIFIDVPAKCNRSIDFIDPLFGQNFAPTRNNTFLVQNCSSKSKSKLGGCVIPPSSFVQIPVEGCNNGSDNIDCYTQLQPQHPYEDVLTKEAWRRIGCKYLFSTIVIDKSKVKELSLQFQVIELGWWLQGTCNCHVNATCTEVHLAGGKQGFRCRCHEGLIGDGFVNGTGCRRGDSVQCNASTLGSNGCGKAVKIGVLVGGITIGASIVAALFLVCYFAKRRSTWLRKQLTVKRLLREAAGIYAGNLHNDEWVAIKKIKYRDTNSVDQVMNEIKLLSSFWVVLVEIITAMKVVDFARPQSEINLAALAVAELAFRCLAFHSDMRPTMIEVAEELEPQTQWVGNYGGNYMHGFISWV
ncbi:Wall-associated receptor kinase, galacturonan-binding domain [Sesbania bispinosa]|nr:Wall-associated receptor kinase, galacturonan-binding domain [Sesbania bispinosa]